MFRMTAADVVHHQFSLKTSSYSLLGGFSALAIADIVGQIILLLLSLWGLSFAL